MNIYTLNQNDILEKVSGGIARFPVSDKYKHGSFFTIPCEDATYHFVADAIIDSETPIARKCLTFGEASELDIAIFSEYTQTIREIASSERVCKKYSVTPNFLESAFSRAIERTTLKQFAKNAALLILSERCSKESLIRCGICSASDIDGIFNVLTRQIPHSCCSEFERRVLTDRILNDFNSGEASLLYCEASSDIRCVFTLPEVHQSIKRVLNSASTLSDNEKSFITNVLISENFSKLSSDEQELFIAYVKKIKDFYSSAERELYKNAVEQTSGPRSYLTSTVKKYCTENNLDYEKLLYYLHKSGKQLARLQRTLNTLKELLTST